MLEGPHIWLDESIWKDLWLIFCLSICIIISLEMGGDVKEAFSKLGGHRNWWFINVNQTEVKTYLSWSVSKFKKKIMEKRPFSLPIFDFQTLYKCWAIIDSGSVVFKQAREKLLQKRFPLDQSAFPSGSSAVQEALKKPRGSPPLMEVMQKLCCLLSNPDSARSKKEDKSCLSPN